jgi:hypothetical protein
LIDLDHGALNTPRKEWNAIFKARAHTVAYNLGAYEGANVNSYAKHDEYRHCWYRCCVKPIIHICISMTKSFLPYLSTLFYQDFTNKLLLFASFSMFHRFIEGERTP